jgi:LacI family transcriptional regulator
LLDVGRAAGVSATAASVVLNHTVSTWKASTEMREKILAAADRLNYCPNAAAQALVNQRIHTLGVVAVVEGGELNDYFLEVLNGILVAAPRHRQNTTVFTLPNWQRSSESLKTFCDGRVDGLILLAPTFSGRGAVVPEHMPAVTIHGNREVPGVTNIESDEECGACTVVSHLIGWRHRRILHLAGPDGLLGSTRRIRGYRRALSEADLPFDPTLVVTAGYSTELGRRALHAWLQQRAGQPLPDAVFCANDAVAVGCLEVLAEFGVRVPEDVSVVGFDDTYVARTILPQLTSVRQPLREMGAHAVELLLERIEADEPNGARPRQVVFPTEIVPRGSVGSRSPVKRIIGTW